MTSELSLGFMKLHMSIYWPIIYFMQEIRNHKNKNSEIFFFVQVYQDLHCNKLSPTIILFNCCIFFFLLQCNTCVSVWSLFSVLCTLCFLWQVSQMVETWHTLLWAYVNLIIFANRNILSYNIIYTIKINMCWNIK